MRGQVPLGQCPRQPHQGEDGRGRTVVRRGVGAARRHRGGLRHRVSQRYVRYECALQLSGALRTENARYPPVTTDRFLACIYGGALIGIGTAIILKVGSSTGGTDLVATVIKGYNPYISMSKYLIIMDIVIISLNVLFFKHIEIGLYSAIAIYLYGQMIDIIFEGVYYTKLLFIISDKNDEIAKEISNEVKRGVTGLYGKGMYKSKDKLVLICAASRNDTAKIKDLAKKIDEKCFIVITNAREVLGKGFKEV